MGLKVAQVAACITTVIQSLEYDSMMLFKWFYDNEMKSNKSKRNLLVSRKDEVTIRIGDTKIKNSEYEKLLGIKVDTKYIEIYLLRFSFSFSST